LGHELRRAIIRLIGDHEFIGFSEIKKATQMSTGTIYHHLEALHHLIAQNAQKKYMLTPQGLHAYQFLNKNAKVIDHLTADFSISETTRRSPLLSRLFFYRFRKWVEHSHLGLRYGTWTILAFIAFFSGLLQVQGLLFFFLPLSVPWFSMPFLSGLLIFLSVPLNFFILAVLEEAFAQLVFHTPAHFREAFRGLVYSFIPIAFYLIIIGIIKLFVLLNLLPMDVFLLAAKLLLALFQVWTALVFAHDISVLKGLSFEKALIIAIFIEYSTFLFLLLLNISGV